MAEVKMNYWHIGSALVDYIIDTIPNNRIYIIPIDTGTGISVLGMDQRPFTWNSCGREVVTGFRDNKGGNADTSSQAVIF